MMLAIIRGVKAKKYKREEDNLKKRYDDACKLLFTPGQSNERCVLAGHCCPNFSLHDMCQQKECGLYNANHDFIMISQKYVQATKKAEDAQEKYENTIRGLREKNISLYIHGK